MITKSEKLTKSSAILISAFAITAWASPPKSSAMPPPALKTLAKIKNNRSARKPTSDNKLWLKCSFQVLDSKFVDTNPFMFSFENDVEGTAKTSSDMRQIKADIWLNYLGRKAGFTVTELGKTIATVEGKADQVGAFDLSAKHSTEATKSYRVHCLGLADYE